MMATISNSTRSIHRTAVGPVRLADLAVGKWRVLTHDEIDAVMGRVTAAELKATEQKLKQRIEKKRLMRKLAREARGEKVADAAEEMKEDLEVEKLAEEEEGDAAPAAPDSKRTSARTGRTRSARKLSSSRRNSNSKSRRR